MPSRPLSADTKAVVKLQTRLDDEAIDLAKGRTALLRSAGLGRARTTEVPRSDGECQFGECRREAQVWRDVNGEFVMAAAQVLDERMPDSDHAG